MRLGVPRTLKGKFALFMAALAVAVALFYSAGLGYVFHVAEETLMGEALSHDLERIATDGKHFSSPYVNEKTSIYVEDDPYRDIPGHLRSVPDGYSEYTRGTDMYVYAKTIDGKRWVIVKNQQDFEHWEREVYRTVRISLSAVLLLVFIAGYFFTRRMLKPLERLERESAAMEETLKSGKIYAADAISDDWKDDEIGMMAKRLKSLSVRLRNMVLQEKRFASEVSHELRTPLTGLMTSLELLETSKNLTERERRVLERATGTSRRMRDLILVFLGQFQNNASTPGTELSLHDLVAGLEPSWKSMAAERALTFEVKEENPPSQRFNELLAGTVISNLVLNAIRYTKEGGVTVRLLPGSVEISDTGAGISEADRERIFDSGYRGTCAKGTAGYGIGLSIARRCAEALGWTIELRPGESRGTTFRIGLS